MSSHITMIVNNEYIQCKDGDEVIYDSCWSLEELLNGGKGMKTTKEQIINKIKETINYNKAARNAKNVYQLYEDATRRSNDVLAKAVHFIENSSEEYERGANDAWGLARKIGLRPTDGGYDCDELYLRFDSYTTSDVFNNYTFQEALEKVKAYEKKKEEEAAKPVLGDVVEFINIQSEDIRRGIFLTNDGSLYTTYLDTNGKLVSIYRDRFIVKKTGEHIDIQGMLDKIGG